MKAKLHLLKIVPVALLVATTAPVFTGCASTQTRESTGQYIDDSVITAKVKTALARDDAVNGFAVNVETYRGVVQLSGFVNTAAEKHQAALDAQGVAGVKDVQNNLSIKPADSTSQSMK